VTVKILVVQGRVPLSAEAAWGQLWRRLLGQSSTPRRNQQAKRIAEAHATAVTHKKLSVMKGKPLEVSQGQDGGVEHDNDSA
jgi:hypothetical protein